MSLDRLTYRNSSSSVKLALRTIILSSFLGASAFVIIPLTAKIEKPEEDQLTIRKAPETRIIKREKEEIFEIEPPKKILKKQVTEQQPLEVPQIDPPPAVPVKLNLSPVETSVSLSVDTDFKTDLNFEVEHIKAVAKVPEKPIEETPKISVAPVKPKVDPIDYEGIFDSSQVDQQARKIKGGAPAYPYRARRRNITGKVTITCVIDKEGRVINPIVTSATPKGYFESVCLETVKDFRYNPALKNGKPVMQRLKVNFDFGFSR